MRIHGEVSAVPHKDSKSWHEISRPQVHGYDLVGVAFVDPLHFVSIADEKVARVFEAPQEFIDVVQNLHAADLHEEAVRTLEVHLRYCTNLKTQGSRPRAATVPPLGLSNKAVTDRA
jgi:elongator complex protein 2